MLGGAHATLWDDNKPIDLNSLVDPGILDAGWVLRRAYDIHHKGWIVGDAYNSKLDVTHAFLLSPVPQPGTCAMLLAGLGLLGLRAHRCKVT